MEKIVNFAALNQGKFPPLKLKKKTNFYSHKTMALDNGSRFIYSLIIVGGSISLFFGVIMGVWYPYSGTIWDAQHHSGCETCPKLVVKFIFKSADKYYSGTFKKHVDYPYKSNTTLEDMYALHPIGTHVNMYVNPLFNSGSTLNGYPWGILAGVILLLLLAVFLFYSVYLHTRKKL